MASRPAWSPISRPALPRVSSATSGFFFCGMIELPVEYASSRVTKPNSLVAQRMTSSAMRDRSTASIAVTNENSATTSRLAVASIEFSDAAGETEFGGDCGRVEAQRGTGEGAGAVRAASRRGHPSRAAGRRHAASAQQCASRWCESSTGCACCRWVRPGIATPRWRSAWPRSASITPRISRGERAGLVAQVHPDERGDLVVARTAGPQPSAQFRAGTLHQPAFERGVHVLVGRDGRERAVGDVAVEAVERGEHAGELVVGQQPGAVQHSGVRA